MNTERLHLEIFLLQHNIHYWRLYKTHNGFKLLLKLRSDQLKGLIDNPVPYTETTKVTVYRSGLVTYKVVNDRLLEYKDHLRSNSEWQMIRNWL
jgi:hypothetical protein